ncbi:hypothetical protein S83_027885, partial [Arachis hypogaea]
MKEGNVLTIMIIHIQHSVTTQNRPKICDNEEEEYAWLVEIGTSNACKSLYAPERVHWSGYPGL